MSSTIEPRASCTGGACAGAFGGLADGAALDLRRADRHADQHARRRLEHAVVVHLADEVLQHLLGVGEIGDHAVLHRAHGGDVPRRAAEHVLGLGAHGDDDLAAAAVVLLHRDDRGLVEHDAAVADIDEGVGRPQVDGEVAGEIAAQTLEHRWVPRSGGGWGKGGKSTNPRDLPQGDGV
jgi:hypothetical protein